MPGRRAASSSRRRRCPRTPPPRRWRPRRPGTTTPAPRTSRTSVDAFRFFRVFRLVARVTVVAPRGPREPGAGYRGRDYGAWGRRGWHALAWRLGRGLRDQAERGGDGRA